MLRSVPSVVNVGLVLGEEMEINRPDTLLKSHTGPYPI